MRSMSQRAATLWVSLALVLAVVLVYGQVGYHDFVSLDDPGYVFDNSHVQSGLSWDSVRWAFTTFHRSNWHPVTWLSHMADFELFGLWAGGPHIVNGVLHAANAVLLFLALSLMTGSRGPSALVAAFFALHPLRVESVAWVSERKDVLSGFFWMLTLLAYLSYVRAPGVRRYLLVFTALALGLMAKPMLVSLPLVLLLLDLWPLGRWQRSSAGRLVVEKLPLLGLALVSSALTLVAQQRTGAIGTLADIPFGLRVANALVAYVSYLGKTLWPTSLAAFYPHPALISDDAASALLGPAVGAGLLLLVVSGLAAYTIRRRPYFAVGWAWFLITLFPVIGILQVGVQAMADRYAYLPLVGIYIAVVWGGRELVAQRPRGRTILLLGALGSLLACAVLSWTQVATWRNTVTLFRHALVVTQDNYFAHTNLASALMARGKLEQAAVHYEGALSIKADHPTALTGLGTLHSRQGRFAQAEALHRRALEIEPDSAIVQNNLGAALFQQRKLLEAAEQVERALGFQPDFAMARSNLGAIYFLQGRFDDAALQLEQALILNPDYVTASLNLGNVRIEQGRPEDAVPHFERVLRIRPDHSIALRKLRELQAALGQAPTY